MLDDCVMYSRHLFVIILSAATEQLIPQLLCKLYMFVIWMMCGNTISVVVYYLIIVLMNRIMWATDVSS